MHCSLLIAVSLLATPFRAYTIVPGLIASAQPSCTYVTFYYDYPAELASATSSFLSSNGFCTIAGSVAPRVAPSPTPGPSLSPSIRNSLPAILLSSSNIASTTRQSPATSTTMSYSCAVSNPPPPSAGRVQLAGINLSGFEWGCGTDGTCDISIVQSPMKPNFDAGGQMTHFVNDDGFNVFRLPVGWQWLVNSNTVASGTLDSGNWAYYDQFVQACLATGAWCLIDIHNYGRFDGQIIGEGGPSNTLFVALWASLAAKYVSQMKVMFGLMNEPWGMNITLWAGTLQAAVTAIRTTTNNNLHTILLPGSDWSSASDLPTSSGPLLLSITNPDSSVENLVFDVHQYLDDGTGENSWCQGGWLGWSFEPLSQWLRCHGRVALLTETGGGNTATCIEYMCPVTAFLNANSDVYLGYIGWAAGGMQTSYVLSETPTLLANGTWKDEPLVQSCMLPLSL